MVDTTPDSKRFAADVVNAVGVLLPSTRSSHMHVACSLQPRPRSVWRVFDRGCCAVLAGVRLLRRRRRRFPAVSWTMQAHACTCVYAPCAWNGACIAAWVGADACMRPCCHAGVSMARRCSTPMSWQKSMRCVRGLHACMFPFRAYALHVCSMQYARV